MVGSGELFAAHVEVVDDNGDRDDDFSANLELSLVGVAPELLSGTRSKKIDSDGVARFEDLSISPGGSYRLFVTGGAAKPDTSSSFLVEASATATALEFQQQPTETEAGAAITPAVTVRAVDGLGLTDVLFTGDVTIAIGTNAGGGILSGTATVAAVAGVATFSDLSINRSGTGYTLAASTSTGGVTGATSSAFDVTTGPASGATSTIDAAPTSVPADGASTSTITVEIFDAAGNPRTAGGDEVVLSTDVGTLGPVTDHGDGTYTATLTAPSAPDVTTVSGTVEGIAISDDATVTFTAVGPGPPSGATSQITASPTSIPADGASTSTITVELRDAAGTPLTTGGDAVVLSTTAGTLGSVTDNGNGTYTATLTASSTAETATVTGTVNGAAISDDATVTFTAVGPGPPSGATSQITASPTSIPANGASTSTITVELRDAAGTPLTTGGDAVVLSTTAGTLGSVTDNGNGTYTATLTAPSTAETATVTGTVNAEPISDDATVTFTAVGPGPPSGATSQITASPTSIPADGASTSTITVELRDAAGTPLTTGGAVVALSTTAGTLGSVTDNGNGTYTAILTAPSSATTTIATVSGTVGGAAITDTATVTFTAVAPVATGLVFGQQPSNTQAGAAISPAVTVRAVDNTGATVTSFTGNVTIAIGTNPAGGTLTGTTTVAAVAGIATFSNLRIDRTGAGYTLAAGASGLTGATSAPFAVTPGPPSGATSTITAAPTSVPANGTSTSTITVELRDALGNRLTSGGAVVALSTTAGTLGPVTDQGNGTYTAILTAPSSATTTIATVSGTVGGAAITDTATVTFTAVAPVATRLVFGQQPTNTQAGAAISPAVTVRAVDGAGTTVTSFTGNVTIAIGTNPAGGTLTGTTTVAAVAGIATFGNLRIDRTGAGYTLAAGASGLTGATSAAFAVTPGPPSGATSTITAFPTSVPADGASTTTITVELRDALGNRRTSGGSVVALSTTAGTLGPVTDRGDGTYTAELTAPSAPATATVSGTVGGAAITDTATVTFTFVPPATVRLVFGQQPSNVQAGVAIAPAVTVRAVDSGGTTVTSFTGNVTIAIGANPAGGTLSGTSTVAASNGVATFSTLSIDRVGIGYRLSTSASGLTGATSAPFAVTPGPPSGATSTITAAPTSVPANGTSTSTITVELRDALGNRLTSGGAVVALSTTAGTLGPVTDQGNGTYTATLTAPSSATTTIATVSGTVGGAAITDTATVTFTAVAPVATRLVFGQQPSNTQAGAAISPAVTVRAVDNTGATVTSFTGNVTIAIGTNPAGGTLTGTTMVAAVAGIATFGNLRIDRTGAGYTLAAGASGLTGTTSAAFAVTPGPPSGATSTITAFPTSVPADGASTTTITVELRDALGNRRTSGGSVVALSTTAGTLGPVTDRGDGTYTAELTAPSAPATATVSGTVGGAGITDTAIVTFTAFTPTITRLVFGQNPVSTQAGATISPPVTVRAVDIGGATVTSFTGSVTISIGTNPGGGTLSGTTTAIAVAGVATFSTLSIDKAASGYTLTATAVGLTGATSAPFAITPGPASGATSTITAAPTSIPAGGASTSTITVELRDALGNRRTTGGNAVVLATTAGTLGPVTDRGDGTYTATLTSSATPGTATISGTVNGAVIVDTATVGFTSTTSATDLAVTASVDDSEPAIGETVVYTIRATNLGSEPATGVEVSYDLSERLEFVSSVPSKGSYSPQLGVWSVGILEPGEGATLQITVEVIR